MVLLISTVLCFILLYSADSLGRRTVVKISSTVIILGCLMTYLIPSLIFKMVAIGFAAGAEGAFSALFTMLINESTRKLFPYFHQF
jgi:MFS family permease